MHFNLHVQVQVHHVFLSVEKQLAVTPVFILKYVTIYSMYSKNYNAFMTESRSMKLQIKID